MAQIISDFWSNYIFNDYTGTLKNDFIDFFTLISILGLVYFIFVFLRWFWRSFRRLGGFWN